MTTLINEILTDMLSYYGNDSRRSSHLIKVYGYAKAIAFGEKVSKEIQDRIEIAALTHDIGIKVSEEKYGSSAGKWQEIEGPTIAREMLIRRNVPEEEIDRICYLIGHHHTYNRPKEIDDQILIEADFIVNSEEDGLSRQAIEKIKKRIFRTKTGIDLLESLYL